MRSRTHLTAIPGIKIAPIAEFKILQIIFGEAESLPALALAAIGFTPFLIFPFPEGEETTVFGAVLCAILGDVCERPYGVPELPAGELLHQLGYLRFHVYACMVHTTCNMWLSLAANAPCICMLVR